MSHFLKLLSFITVQIIICVSQSDITDQQMSAINGHCKYNTDCVDFFTVCFDGKCVCEANYKYNKEYCEPFKCSDDNQCQNYDHNRICNKTSSECVCRLGLSEYYYNGKCQNHCDDNIVCNVNQFCHNNICKCRLNYILNSDNFCEHFRCRKNSDCWTVDNNRICVNGECVCVAKHYEDYQSMKCVRNHFLIPPPDARHSWTSLWLIIVSLSVGAVVAVLYLRHKKNQMRNGFASLPQNTDNQYL